MGIAASLTNFAQPSACINTNKTKYSLRSLLLAPTITPPATATTASHARATLNACAGGVSSGFQQACEGHSGYFAINLKLSGDGGCLEMCCTGDSSSGYTCLSDPNAIRRVSALWVGPQLSIITASKEGAIAPAPAGVVITVTVAPEAEK